MPNIGTVNAYSAGGKCACVMMLNVARPARQAEISASVSDLSGPTSTNTAEPHTTPATPAAAASRQPQRADAVSRSIARRYAPDNASTEA
jgi:hypothetical protein